MRIGLFAIPTSVDAYVDSCQQAATEGFKSIWSPQIFGPDALTVIAIAGREVPDLEFATAVVPTYPRHPLVLAYQAKTTSQAVAGRFTLGIGLSHKVVIEGTYGYSFDKPARHMREYLAALLPALRGEAVDVVGETLTAKGSVKVASPPVPVMLAAMAPAMLRLAGSVTDGTVLWMTGARTIRERIAPALREAAAAAGRPAPRIAAGLPVCLTADVDRARSRAAKEHAVYGRLPSYRAMLDAEGCAGPADLAAIGDEAVLRRRVDEMRDAGVTDFACAPFGSADEQAATRAFVGSLASG